MRTSSCRLSGGLGIHPSYSVCGIHRNLKRSVRIENDPRLTHEAMREPEYYRKQSEMMAKFLRILGLTLTIIFSLGAVIGAMITMYARSPTGRLKSAHCGRSVFSGEVYSRPLSLNHCSSALSAVS